jgi:hypothetical protein
MAGRKAVKAGEVKATAATAMYPPAVAGAWVAGPVIETASGRHGSGGAPFLREARCTFNFTGTGPPPAHPPIAAASTVVLSPQTTGRRRAWKVLRDGDSATDPYGNELRATVGGKP